MLTYSLQEQKDCYQEIPKEQVHVIALRSEKQLEHVQKESSEIVHQNDIGEEVEDNQRTIGQSREEFSATQPKIQPNSRTTLESEPDSKPAVKPLVKLYVPSLSFPQRLRQNKIDKDLSNFFNVLKNLHINIPFIDALE